MLPDEVKEELTKEIITEEQKSDDPHLPTFNDRRKKFVYEKDPKRVSYIECPTCKIRIYHKHAIEVVKCNDCGYAKPTTDKKFVLRIKKRCQICNKKRKLTNYIMPPNNITLSLCKKCYTEDDATKRKD